jgi:transposase
MAKRVTVTTKRTTEELHDRYRSATDAVERTHWHILWLMKEGHTPDEIARMLGYTARWVRTIVQRWNKAGEQGIRDHRRTLPGAACLLSSEQQKELEQALDQPPADGGLWNGLKVAAWMQERLGRPVDPRRGWDYLQRLGYSTRVPRPQHEQSNQVEQSAFKKTARGGRQARPHVSRSQNRTVEPG